MPSPKRLSELIHAIYAAAEEPALWEPFLDMLVEDLDSGMAVLIAVGGPSPASNIAAAARTNPDAVRLYNEHWAAEDPWLKSGHESLSREGAVVLTQQLVDDRAIVKTEFYNDFMRQFDMFHAAVATILSEPGMTAGLACHYPNHRRPCGPQQLELLALLTPHLGQALRLHGRLVGERANQAASTAALERASAGFVLTDGKGRVRRVNGAGEAILRRGDALKMLAGKIIATAPSANWSLQAAIGAAAATATTSGTSPGATMRLPRGPGRLPYVVSVVPVSGGGPLFCRYGGVVALLIADPEAKPRFDQETMQRIFGWTAAESRVALQLLTGLRPRDISDQHAVSFETVRTQIKSLFAKAGIRSQTELVRVLMNVALVLSAPPG